MSRYELQKQVERQVVTVAYGFDSAVGYFYQEGTESDLLVERDSLFHGLTGLHLAEHLCGGSEALIACLAEAAPFPPDLNPQHIQAMLLDLPF